MPGNTISGNCIFEAGRNRLCNHGCSNVKTANLPFEPSQIRTSETATLSPRTQINGEDQIPPRYEDIESHLIVTPQLLSVNYSDDTVPPKYEEIIQS